MKLLARIPGLLGDVVELYELESGRFLVIVVDASAGLNAGAEVERSQLEAFFAGLATAAGFANKNSACLTVIEGSGRQDRP